MASSYDGLIAESEERVKDLRCDVEDHCNALIEGIKVVRDGLLKHDIIPPRDSRDFGWSLQIALDRLRGEKEVLATLKQLREAQVDR